MNVGVLVYCEQRKFIKLKTRTARGRLAKAYPGIDHGSFRETMKALERRFDRMATDAGLFMPSARAGELGRTVLRADDSSLQWGFSGVGLTDDPEKTLDAHFDRLVLRYDAEHGRDARTDEMVFEAVRRRLEMAELLHLVEPHTVRSKFATVTFDHALKNGIWHCIQPLSFDSADEDRMLSKAARWVGIMQSIASRQSEVKAYFVTGAPQDERLLPQYDKMVEFLRASPMNPVVVDENNASYIVEVLEEYMTH